MILFPFFAQDLMARLSLLRGQMQEAEAHGRLAMQFLSIGPAWGAHNVPVYIEALLGLGQASEAAKVAEQSLGVLAAMGGLGMAEVGIRFAAGEALHAAGQSDRANRELRETLRQIQLRADDITDPFWKNSYLTRNPYCVRAQQLAKEWGLDVIVK